MLDIGMDYALCIFHKSIAYLDVGILNLEYIQIFCLEREKGEMKVFGFVFGGCRGIV
jgi:hypothetical protein